MSEDRAKKKPAYAKALKWVLGFAVYSSTLLVVCFALAFWWGTEQFGKPGPLREPRLFVVERGTGVREISQNLHAQGVTDNPHIFAFGTMVLGAHDKLKAGEYEIKPQMSPRQIMNLLESGKTFARRFTVPEGRTSFEAVEIISKAADLTGEVSSIPPEGSLLPDTYDYRRGESREEVIARMRQAMMKTLDSLWLGRASDLPFSTREEALILASIIEKETGKAEERRAIAGVFINRLRLGIPLQSDPTVIYAITKGRPENAGQGPLGRRLLSKDLEIDSPYNTYKNPGLPPGPIANPGKASIEAALNPETHDFIYFVADGTGGHIFARTLAEHNRNVAQWRKARAVQEKTTTQNPRNSAGK